MSCRESRYSSAIVTFVRDMTGLADNQVLALSHALMTEGVHNTVTDEQWRAAIADAANAYNEGTYRINPGSHDPIARLNAANEERADGTRVYAGERLLERARRATDAQTEYLTDLAQDTGQDMREVTMAFQSHFAAATTDRRLSAPRDFVRAWNSNADHAGLLVDRRSLYAYSQLEQQRQTVLATRASMPTVTREPMHSTFISEAGYDEATGYTEVVMRSNPDRVYRYRLAPTDWADWMSSDRPGSYFNQHIRSNPAFAYDTVSEAAGAGQTPQCATCGQFAASSHSCPVPGSPAAIEADVAAAVVAAAPATVPAQAPAPTPRVFRGERTMRYIQGESTLRIPGVTLIRAAARDETIRIHALSHIALTGGASDTATGSVDITRLPNGQFQVEAVPVDASGTPGVRTLRCYCEDYRRDYRCEHTEALVRDLTTLLNSSPNAANLTARATTRTATTRVNRNNEVDNAASLEASEQARARFTPLAESLQENPEKFQELYEQARAARAAYAAGESTDYPVEYLEENAFGGLGGDRGFGIEIEYSFPNTMSSGEATAARRAIGQELYDLGLTASAAQAGYGASHGRVRTSHDRGWSYESDPTVYDNETRTGGEIVSPVMQDTPETWRNIKAISEILRRNGAVPSKGAGMHVHVSVGDFNHRIDVHNELLGAYAENEDLIYRMHSNPERGRHRGGAYNAPNRLPANPYTDLGRLRAEQSSHGIAMNFQSVQGRSGDHVEVRTPDSSLEPAVMQAQIATAIYLAEGAMRGGVADTNPSANPSRRGTRLSANPTRAALAGDAWNESTAGFRKFLDTFVPGREGSLADNPQLRQLVSLFAMTKWQGSRR